MKKKRREKYRDFQQIILYNTHAHHQTTGQKAHKSKEEKGE